MYAQIKNKAIEKYPYLDSDLRTDNPSTSFQIAPLTNADLRNKLGIVEVEAKPIPEHNKQTHECSEKTPVLKDGTWSQVWETKSKTVAKKTQDDAKQWQLIRNQRNQKLAECDWEMIKAMENEKDAVELRAYRKKLRDIPQDQTNPFSITWPERSG